MTRIRVLIADDHVLLREGLRKILSHYPEFEIVGEAINGKEAVDMTEALKPDVVLMDISMPEINGVEATRIIKSSHQEIRVISLTMYDDDEHIFDAIRAGAAGYLLKDVSSDKLSDAIKLVNSGESLIPAHILKKLFATTVSANVDERPKEIEKEQDALTEREYDVLKLIASGSSNKEIGKVLFISEKTVKNHISSILRKLRVSDRTQAAIEAIKLKLVEFK